MLGARRSPPAGCPPLPLRHRLPTGTARCNAPVRNRWIVRGDGLNAGRPVLVAELDLTLLPDHVRDLRDRRRIAFERFGVRNRQCRGAAESAARPAAP